MGLLLVDTRTLPSWKGSHLYCSYNAFGKYVSKLYFVVVTLLPLNFLCARCGPGSFTVTQRGSAGGAIWGFVIVGMLIAGTADGVAKVFCAQAAYQ